jgi:hypothetical protein
MLITTHTHTYFPEAALAVSVTPCQKLDNGRLSGHVLALAERCAR